MPRGFRLHVRTLYTARPGTSIQTVLWPSALSPKRVISRPDLSKSDQKQWEDFGPRQIGASDRSYLIAAPAISYRGASHRRSEQCTEEKARCKAATVIPKKPRTTYRNQERLQYPKYQGKKEDACRTLAPTLQKHPAIYHPLHLKWVIKRRQTITAIIQNIS